MTDVVMSPPFHLSRTHWQKWLGSIQRLDLAVLINARHQGLLGRVQVESDHVRDRRPNSGSVLSLNPRAIWLQVVLPPHTLHGAEADAQVFGQQASAPVGSSTRRLAQRAADDLRHHRLAVHLGTAPTQRVYTLGNWFDIWGIPLDRTHIGPASGTAIAYVNGQRYSGDLRAIPLNAHDLIQLDVNGDSALAPFILPVGD